MRGMLFEDIYVMQATIYKFVAVRKENSRIKLFSSKS